MSRRFGWWWCWWSWWWWWRWWWSWWWWPATFSWYESQILIADSSSNSLQMPWRCVLGISNYYWCPPSFIQIVLQFPHHQQGHNWRFRIHLIRPWIDLQKSVTISYLSAHSAIGFTKCRLTGICCFGSFSKNFIKPKQRLTCPWCIGASRGSFTPELLKISFISAVRWCTYLVSMAIKVCNSGYGDGGGDGDDSLVVQCQL